MLKKWCAILALVTAMWSPLTSLEQDLLKPNDVDRIMNQILSQHLGNKEITEQIIQHSILIYINQFDPQRMYLIQSEVAPYVNLSSAQLAALVTEYKESHFALFKKLNDLFQETIIRSRKMRTAIETKDKEKLFGNNAIDPKLFADEKLDLFPENVSQLEERMMIYLASYIEQQKQKYGQSEAAQKKEAILQNYENKLREFENQYLYQNGQGEPLPEAEQENLFSIHIIKALASSLDAHTSFYQAKEAYDMRVRLQKEFQGVGLGLKNTPEGIKVSRLIEGGPAAKSGLIQPGDILLSIDEKSILGTPFEEVIDLLHGDKKTVVKLGFKRLNTSSKEATNIDVSLNRAEIFLNEDRVDTSFVPFGNGIIGKIRLHSFYQGEDISSEKDVRHAIEELRKKGNLKGLVFDLRENTGGFLSQAVKVGGLFISNGVIVISKYSNGEKRFYRDVEGQEAYDGPLVILTSKTTASAAEIVAQALQDYGVAIVVGDEQTYGKGTIQTQTVTDNQSSSYFKVTVGEYYTVSGKTPQKQGVKADIVVPSRWHAIQVGEGDSIEPDTIPPSFEDTLDDVKPTDKAWYLKYYMPTLQHRTEVWRNLLPTLRKNSEYRLAHNDNFKLFLKGGEPDKKEEDEVPSSEEMEAWMLGGKLKTYGVDDLQMDEAVNIVEDMIMLHHIEKKNTAPSAT